MSVINKCKACGASYTADTWGCLKCLGQSEPINDGEKPDILEYRDCPCGSTLAVWLDDDGQISADQLGGEMIKWWITCLWKLTRLEHDHVREHGVRIAADFQRIINEQAELEARINIVICRTCRRIAKKLGMQPENGSWGDK